MRTLLPLDVVYRRALLKPPDQRLVPSIPERQLHTPRLFQESLDRSQVVTVDSREVEIRTPFQAVQLSVDSLIRHNLDSEQPVIVIVLQVTQFTDRRIQITLGLHHLGQDFTSRGRSTDPRPDGRGPSSSALDDATRATPEFPEYESEFSERASRDLPASVAAFAGFQFRPQ